MAITDQGRLSLAILISAIFEDENKDIIETAQQYISKNSELIEQIFILMIYLMGNIMVHYNLLSL